MPCQVKHGWHCRRHVCRWRSHVDSDMGNLSYQSRPACLQPRPGVLHHPETILQCSTSRHEDGPDTVPPWEYHGESGVMIVVIDNTASASSSRSNQHDTEAFCIRPDLDGLFFQYLGLVVPCPSQLGIDAPPTFAWDGQAGIT